MIKIIKEDKEVNIVIKFSETVGGGCKVDILGEGDLSHHLIEGLFEMIDKLARMEKVDHQSEEWRKR